MIGAERRLVIRFDARQITLDDGDAGGAAFANGGLRIGDRGSGDAEAISLLRV